MLLSRQARWVVAQPRTEKKHELHGHSLAYLAYVEYTPSTITHQTALGAGSNTVTPTTPFVRTLFRCGHLSFLSEEAHILTHSFFLAV